MTQKLPGLYSFPGFPSKGRRKARKQSHIIMPATTSFAAQLGLPLAPPPPSNVPNSTSTAPPPSKKSKKRHKSVTRQDDGVVVPPLTSTDINACSSGSTSTAVGTSFASLTLPITAPPGHSVTKTEEEPTIASIHHQINHVSSTGNRSCGTKRRPVKAECSPPTPIFPPGQQPVPVAVPQPLPPQQQHHQNTIVATTVATASTNTTYIPTEADISNLLPTTSTTTSVSKSENKWSRNGFGQPIHATMGRFTPSESMAVQTAIQNYCSKNSIDPSSLCSDTDHRSDRLRGAWQHIAQELPHRTVQSVYRHGLRLHHPFKRGPWSEEETMQLHVWVGRYGKKWSAIQAKMNRSADACRDKYREFSSDFHRGRWNEEETKGLIQVVKEVLRLPKEVASSSTSTGVSPMGEGSGGSSSTTTHAASSLALENKAEFQRVAALVEQKGITLPWSVISKRVGNRSRLSC